MAGTSDSKRDKIARFGIGMKGVVYCIVGILALMTAFGYGGKKTGSTGVIDYIASMSFGNVLLFIVAVGLFAYSAWRLYQTFADEKNKGKDKTGLVWRFAFFLSGIFYGYVAYQAMTVIFQNEQATSGNSQEQAAQLVLTQPWGQVLLVLVAGIILFKAGYQIYKSYSGKYKKELDETKLSNKERNALVTAGKIGFLARGIVIGVVAYFFFKAAFFSSAQQAGGTKEAFQFLHSSLGSIGFGIIAAGLVAYGIYMLLKAKYREISIS
jgi:hypothetical protein